LKNLVPKVNIAGVSISNISLTETIQLFNACIKQEQKIRVCVTPVNCLVWANKSQQLADLYNTADLVLCDGVPVIWASKLLSTPLKGRVTGLDLLPLYIEEAYKKGFSMFFLGAKEGVAAALAEKYRNDCPDIKINGVYAPPYADEFSEQENQKIISLINAAAPDILWVSLTAPKQDYWIQKNLDKINTNIAIGVGGAFEVTAGLIKRAPLWMQKMGLEWLFRFINEPKRLFKRYLVEAPEFIPLIIKQLFKKTQ
jgi:N-acetylglucosaminyldiphosphoundecaprenol N-acetyl-beta-D-mannosaminyltransferase